MCAECVLVGVCLWQGKLRWEAEVKHVFFMAEDLCLLGNSLSSTPAKALRPHYSHACTRMRALPTTSFTNPHVDTWMHKSKHTECNPKPKPKLFFTTDVPKGFKMLFQAVLLNLDFLRWMKCFPSMSAHMQSFFFSLVKLHLSINNKGHKFLDSDIFQQMFHKNKCIGSIV